VKKRKSGEGGYVIDRWDLLLESSWLESVFIYLHTMIEGGEGYGRIF
jgi:hypothetical protein